MNSYEQKLREFAQGKHFLRMAKPLRDRADAVCDACGSPLPRTLYGLKDRVTERYYFVGHSCIAELATLGVIARQFSREAANRVYETEMRRRAHEHTNSPVHHFPLQGAQASQHPGGSPQPALVSPQVPPLAASSENHVSQLATAVFVQQTAEHYRAVVTVTSPDGSVRTSAQASETRFAMAWRRVGGAVLLEKVAMPRPDALVTAVQRAWEQARAQLPEEHLGALPPSAYLNLLAHRAP